MKKVLAILLCVAMMLSMAACGAAEAPAKTETSETKEALVVDTCILKEADDKMLNTYSAIAVNPEAPFVDADGNALSNALFRIRPESFVVDTLAEECENCLDLQSDSLGKTELEELPEGSYIVEGIYKNLRGFVKMNAEDILDSLTLVPVGGISGQLALPENVKHGWVQLKGLDYLAKTDEDGYFQLDSLPVGDIQILAIIPGDTLATLSVAVRSKKVNKVGLLGKYKEPTKDSIPENEKVINIFESIQKAKVY